MIWERTLDAMDAYPAEYLRHELPLITLYGLGHQSASSTSSSTASWNPSPGATIIRELPIVSVSFADSLRDEFHRADGTEFPWNGTGNPQRQGLIGFKFSTVGDSFIFPRRKAAPAAQTPGEELSNPLSTNSSTNSELHSTLSPLSPTSPLFPDGLFSTSWMSKHQQHVPSVLLCFFDLKADLSISHHQDDQLKTEIGRVKTALSRSGYRTRLAVVILSDEGSSEIEERVSNLRRTTGLDPKTSFFTLSKPRTQAEITAFVCNTLVALQPVCIDYYRDLTKHSRRKKNRGYIPAPTGSNAKGTSQSLTTSGWHARYEFKQGIFAEFRQEMDAAERHFAFAIDELFNAEGVLESTPIWSLRWTEARILADITAMRVLRCQLWRGLTSGAAESWSNYRDRTRALVDRRGKGSDTYGYAAWESRWSQIMAELINRAEVPAFQVKPISSVVGSEEEDDYVAINISATPEKAYANMERLVPFQILHHPGYWYRMAHRWAVERYRRIKSLPSDDRSMPGDQNSSQLRDRSNSFDVYLVSPPHEELPAGSLTNDKIEAQILSLGEMAEYEFDLRKQFRFKSLLALQRAHVLAEAGSHQSARQALLPVWTDMAWRSEGWWDLAGEVILNLYKLAVKLEEQRLCAELKWEMLCKVFGNLFHSIFTGPHVGDRSGQVALHLEAKTRLSPISVTFCFASEDAHVGDVVPCQLTLAFTSVAKDTTLEVGSVVISLGGGTCRIRIGHSKAEVLKSLQDLELVDIAVSSDRQERAIDARADLRITDKKISVLNFGLQLRNVGEIEATEVCIDAAIDSFPVQCRYHPASLTTSFWWIDSGKGLYERSLDRDDTLAIDVLPKPPRVQLKLSEPSTQYFTSEDVVLSLVVVNEESEPVRGSIKVDASAEVLTALNIRWKSSQDAVKDSEEEEVVQEFGTIGPLDKAVYELCIRTPAEPATAVLSFSIDYTVGEDRDTTINKAARFGFDFVRPVDAMFELFPRLDDEAWPSFFSMPVAARDEEVVDGIRQKWVLSTQIASLAHGPLLIEDVALVVSKTGENIVCEMPTKRKIGAAVSADKEGSHIEIPFFTRRRSLDDRRSTPLSLELHVTWRRQESAAGPLATTVIPVPTFQMPPAEPRLLCTASALDFKSTAETIANTRTVKYTIENPSVHFLTFSLAMDASDQFAFSGPKLRSISLTPLSRVTVGYRIMLLSTESVEKSKGDANGVPNGSKGKWVFPALKVTDSYFNKTLRVVPAGPGVKMEDRKSDAAGSSSNIGVWVPIGASHEA